MGGLELSREQLQALMMRLHGIGSDRRIAMMGRLKHLQRLGWPPESNLGKGRRVKYSPQQVAQVALALELIQLGLTPERAVSTLELHDAQIARLLATPAAHQEWGSPNPSLLLFDPMALSEALDSGQDQRDVQGPDIVRHWINEGRRVAILNVSNLVAEIDRLLADLDFAKPAHFRSELLRRSGRREEVNGNPQA